MTVNSKVALKAYVYLIILTIISAFLGEVNFNLTDDLLNVFLVGIILISILKGIQIVDVFMELKHAPVFWRKLLWSYVILVPTIISLIYLIF